MRIKSQIYLIILTFYPMIITNLMIFFPIKSTSVHFSCNQNSQ